MMEIGFCEHVRPIGVIVLIAPLMCVFNNQLFTAHFENLG